MRRKHCLPLFLSIVLVGPILLPLCAHADSMVLGLDETTFATLPANTTLSQDVQVSAPTTIDGFAFFLSDPSGAPVTYSITDLTTGTTLFTETLDDTTLNPALTNIAIPTGSRAWLEAYMPPTTLPAGGDTYQFSLSGAGALDVGVDPASSTGTGMEAVNGSEAGLRVWDPPAALTPEPSPLIMLGTGFLALVGAVGHPRKRTR